MKEVIVYALNMCSRPLEEMCVARPGTTKADNKVKGEGAQKMKLKQKLEELIRDSFKIT